MCCWQFFYSTSKTYNLYLSLCFTLTAFKMQRQPLNLKWGRGTMSPLSIGRRQSAAYDNQSEVDSYTFKTQNLRS